MMAGPACMSEDDRPAVFVGTMLETGDSVALCDICLVGWAAALLNVMTGVDPEPFLRAVSEPEPDPNQEALPFDGAPPASPPAGGDSGPISQGEPAAQPKPRGRGGKAGRRAQETPGRTSNGLAGPGTGTAPDVIPDVTVPNTAGTVE